MTQDYENGQAASFEDLLAKARSATSAEDLKARAAQAGVDITDEEARAAFSKLHAAQACGEIADDELDSVAGGCGSQGIEEYYMRCPFCGGDVMKRGNAPAYCTGCGRGGGVL